MKEEFIKESFLVWSRLKIYTKPAEIISEEKIVIPLEMEESDEDGEIFTAFYNVVLSWNGELEFSVVMENPPEGIRSREEFISEIEEVVRERHEALYDDSLSPAEMLERIKTGYQHQPPTEEEDKKWEEFLLSSSSKEREVRDEENEYERKCWQKDMELWRKGALRY